jgi:hypothetical protein
MVKAMPTETKPPNHLYKDIGEPIADPDFVARPARNWWGRAVDPEAYLREKFEALKKDYGGPITSSAGLARKLCRRPAGDGADSRAMVAAE